MCEEAKLYWTDTLIKACKNKHSQLRMYTAENIYETQVKNKYTIKTWFTKIIEYLKKGN